PVERDGLLSSWFTCEINHSHPRALSPASGTFITFCALTFPPHSGHSYATGGYFVGVLPVRCSMNANYI
ncbi:hypothetical protein ELS58_24330, partial [Salmonella enterica subsp. enterica serovar Typhimurium]|nr:hypothetical protein [Salmonella enterica subsp. enterica serovar Typhimurium]